MKAAVHQYPRHVSFAYNAPVRDGATNHALDQSEDARCTPDSGRRYHLRVTAQHNP